MAWSFLALYAYDGDSRSSAGMRTARVGVHSAAVLMELAAGRTQN